MARHKGPPKSDLEVSLPVELKLKIELFLRHDPITGKVAHGEWSKLATRLFERYLAEQGEKHVADQ